MTAFTSNDHLSLILIATLTVAVCGCSAKTGTVKGKAIIDGKPAAGATVVFSNGDENRSSVIVLIQSDGTYEASGVPIGPVKVTVVASPMLSMGGMSQNKPGVKKKGPDMGGPAALAALFPAIPKRYSDANTSGLTLTVTGGRNEFDITMTSP